METKSIEQIKDDYAGEHGRDSWEEFFQWNKLCHVNHDTMEGHYDEIMKRYAQQFQNPTDVLATEVCVLRERVEELEGCLSNSKSLLGRLRRSISVHPDNEEGSEFDDLTTDAQNFEDEVEVLINKSK